jgi:hypothetical protein
MTITRLTPELARRWLGDRGGVPPASRAIVESFAAAMRAGQYGAQCPQSSFILTAR